jgi:hypothetical protein
MNDGIFSPNNNVFFKVVGSSGENLLYLSENFINGNISRQNSNTIVASAFIPGELVFQQAVAVATGDLPDFNLATFVARVEYYNVLTTTVGTLALTPISGKMNASATANDNANTSSFLWSASNTSTKPVLMTGVKLNNLANGWVLIDTANSAKHVSVLSHEHSSGIVANSKANTIESGGQFVYLNSSNVTIANGNLMYFTAGTGMGQLKRVIEVSDKLITLNSALLVDPTNTTKYSIGNHIVDINGSLNGIINLPEEPNFKFRVGDRVFTITDVDKLTDTDYTMSSKAVFAAGGLQNSRQVVDVSQQVSLTPKKTPPPESPPDEIIVPPPPTRDPRPPRPTVVPRRARRDPIAQTFFTPKAKDNKVNYGVFVSSIDLFFGAKPNVANGSLQFPIFCKIAEVVNGYPTVSYLASSVVKCKDVKVSTAPSVSDANTYTNFAFTDPVYLQPDTEYAIVIQSDSPEYECYIAELGGTVLNADPPQRISEQPYSGSFFRSQNASTWTAYQNEDLMFIIRKAVFATSGSAIFNLKNAPIINKDIDRLFLNMDKLTFPVSEVDFGVRGIFKSNSAFDSSSSGIRIKAQQIFKYGNLLDASNKANSGSFLNTRKLVLGNSNSVIVRAEFSTSDTDLSPIFNMETLGVVAGTHDVNNAGIANDIISITQVGEGYNATVALGNSVFGSSNNTLNNAAQLFRKVYLANNYNVGLYLVTISGNTGSGADGFAVSNTDSAGSNTVDYIVINSTGSGYIETPTIAIANGNAATNVTSQLSILGETSKRGGNMKARYLTRQIALEDGFESGDLRVFMDAIRPNGTDIQVYYKVKGLDDTDRFDDKSWVRMFKTVDKKSKDVNELIELEFRPDLLNNTLKYVENGRQYPVGGSFKYFAVKVCLTAVDSTIIPTVTNLRIIATPEG